MMKKNWHNKCMDRLTKESDSLLLTRANLRNRIITTFYSLKKLLYDDISEERFDSILHNVSSGKYSLSPLVFQAVVQLPPDIPLLRRLLFHSTDDHYYYIRPRLEDDLVLTSLGYLVYSRFASFCFSPYYKHMVLEVDDHYSVVCNKSFRYHYLLDLSETIERVERESILFFLKHFVEDEYLFLLIKEFLYLDDQSLYKEGQSLFVGIPPIGFFSDILMNIFYQIYDVSFSKAFPSAHYTRYMHEVVISSHFPIEKDDLTYPAFNQSTVDKKDGFNSLKISFSGCFHEIQSITKCHGGELSVNQNGLLSFHKSREQTQLDEQNQLEDHIKTMRLDDP